MAAAAAVNFGEVLQDQATPLANLIATNLTFIADVRSFYAERVNLEREYAKSLQALVVKAQGKQFAIQDHLVAGDAPSKAVREGAARDHTLDSAWHTILAQADEEAYSRSNYAESMQVDVVDGLKNLGRRMDALRTKHTDFSNNLVKERDNAYALKAKAKEKYDACCRDVEQNRQKAEGSKSDRKAEKASALTQQYMTEMYNAKNAYLLSIEVSNRMRDKYFEKDLPGIHNDLQALWSTIVNRLKMIVAKGTESTKRQYEVLLRYTDQCIQAIATIDPARDQALYADYNVRPFFAPPDFTFEPCSIWHDNDKMNLDPEPKVFLQNKLIRNQQALEEVIPRVEAARRESGKLAELRDAYTKNPALGDLDSVTEGYFEAVREAVSLETERDTLEAEIMLLKDTLGGDVGSGRSHDFKPSNFPVSKQCYVCQQKIWGMGKDCGTVLHTACELKCPADCGDPTLAATRAASAAQYANSSPRSRTTSVNGSIRDDDSSRRVSMVHSRSSSSMATTNGGGGSRKSAKAVYDYASQASSQLSIVAGETLDVVSEDTGHGWTKVSNSQGNTGIVPTSYIKVSAAAAPSSTSGVPPPSLARRPTTASITSTASGQSSTGGGGGNGSVRAVYAYSGQSAKELTIEKGEVLELTGKGHKIAPGWTEVYQNGRKGIVPTSYVR